MDDITPPRDTQINWVAILASRENHIRLQRAFRHFYPEVRLRTLKLKESEHDLLTPITVILKPCDKYHISIDEDVVEVDETGELIPMIEITTPYEETSSLSGGFRITREMWEKAQEIDEYHDECVDMVADELGGDIQDGAGETYASVRLLEITGSELDDIEHFTFLMRHAWIEELKVSIPMDEDCVSTCKTLLTIVRNNRAIDDDSSIIFAPPMRLIKNKLEKWTWSTMSAPILRFDGA